MSISTFKMGIIAGNVMVPGFSTFISNLIFSSSISTEVKNDLPNWLIEYTHGLTQEIYVVRFAQDKH